MGIFGRKQKEPRPLIDLAALERARATAPPPRFGLPTPCPECSAPGYLDHIDPFREVMYQHCPSCWHKWELSRAEIEQTAHA